jgi:hypothetical protein
MFEAPTGVVITTRRVMEQGRPILLVTHDDEEPRGWQFLNGHGDTDDPTCGITVYAEHVVERDSSVAGLADPPLGLHAWRADESVEWIREPIPSEEYLSVREHFLTWRTSVRGSSSASCDAGWEADALEDRRGGLCELNEPRMVGGIEGDRQGVRDRTVAFD